MDLQELSLTRASKGLSRGDFSALDLARAHLEHIERLNPHLNAFLTVTSELALDQARAADRARAAGQSLSPLHGLPLALKDLFETQGIRTTAGSAHLRQYVPDRDAEVVARLKAAGAVILGKLQMHEWAFGVTSQNPHYGDCRNPWDLDRVSGGSSGGAGAALAAGLCPGALGSDTGGSIRIPAALCGVAGLKPTHGRVSLRGVLPLSWNLDHAGPMARRVADLGLMLSVLAGHDPQDPYSQDIPVGDYLSGLAGSVVGWRIALAADDYYQDADEAVRAAVETAAKVFSGMGARVEHTVFPVGREAHQANVDMLLGDAAAVHKERLEKQPEAYGLDVGSRLARGASLPAPVYAAAHREQRRAIHQCQAFFQDFDLLLTPATPITAPLRRGADPLGQAPQMTRFTAPFNLTGLPALVLPCGFDSQGLPIGLQLVGPAWEEARLLQAGNAYERATAWHRQHPTLDG